MRYWVALAFWHAGVVKFDDPSGTATLFSQVYHVPMLPTAASLFVYNIIAVSSYPDLRPPGFWHGLAGKPPVQWQHYPEDRPGAEEHGHFHLFVRPEGWNG